MEKCNVQVQIFKCLMMYEIQGSSTEAFLFHINGYILHFTVREFALIFGLKCGDENAPELTFNTEEPNKLRS